MCDRGKLLLAAIVFYYKVTAGSAKLDMAPNAVDYMYNGCREEAMENFIHSGLLRQELNNSKEFQKAWDADTRCLKLIPGGTKEHTAALLAYADWDEDGNTFDNAVETLGGNENIYEKQFHFKALHFLLMDSMLLLSTKKCTTLYAVQEKEYTAQKGSKVRFGRFAKVHSSVSKLMVDLHRQVLFNITSCFFANLGDNICSQDQSMTLISPAEVFTVEAVNEKTEDDSEFTEIVLKHSELDSSHNCYSLSGSPADVSTKWLVLMLVALSLFFFNY
ncbi:ecto-ADP-ribosyltransferase 4 [Anarrhichthys ocellatus]|uniref:ecto-ADP-ribosyltransferase 4 n=1 Tax=Anarrhichthys ocellatus TaxID=433405 RepID=UPI0012ECD15A|nr:ecto-ADP-ribosyltransferase 4-like [Anarrhichthys ocellatus]